MSLVHFAKKKKKIMETVFIMLKLIRYHTGYQSCCMFILLLNKTDINRPGGDMHCDRLHTFCSQPVPT